MKSILYTISFIAWLLITLFLAISLIGISVFILFEDEWKDMGKTLIRKI